jgi:hypothetical protein
MHAPKHAILENADRVNEWGKPMKDGFGLLVSYFYIKRPADRLGSITNPFPNMFLGRNKCRKGQLN